MDPIEPTTPAPDDAQAQPPASAPEPGPAPEPEAQPFTEGFDPNALPEPLQERYRQMHGDYTRKTQELSEQRKQIEQAQEDLTLLDGLRNDPEAQKAFFAELVQTYGVDALNEWLPDDEEPGPDDPLSAFNSRLEAIEAAEQQRQASAQAAQLEAQLNEEIDALSQTEGVKFTKDERELLLDTTVTAMLQTNQAPDVNGAYQRLKAAEKAWQERYLASKNPGGTPPPAGPAGSPDIDLKDPDKRRERGIAALQAARG